MVKNDNAISLCYHAPNANTLSIKLFDPNSGKEIAQHALKKKNGNFFTTIEISDPNILYKLLIDNHICHDPFSKALKMSPDFKTPGEVFSQFTFDFSPTQKVRRPKINHNNLIIYEVHVRGFTMDPSSKTGYPGTFKALKEKIPYLKELGINALQLMPVMAFDPTEHPLQKSHSLLNYWGYNTLNFFALMPSYASGSDRLSPLVEFNALVEALHEAGIAIILDVVYNHTSWQCRLDLFDKKEYYILNNDKHTNYSGCGNTVNANSPAAKKLIIDSLCYFAKEFNVDGFRFDLASALTRDSAGNPLRDPPLIKSIVSHPILQDRILIAEPWDAAGLFEPGTFCSDKFLQHNANCRDTVRKTVQEGIIVKNLEKVLQGSYTHTINFVTCHDGFTLNDLVSYQEKHNEMNCENNTDGCHQNFSSNSSVEGETSSQEILALRKNKAFILIALAILAKGSCMLKMSDEYLHTTKGNNNPYCHDSALNYFAWDKLAMNKDVFAFIQKMIALKKAGLFQIHITSNKALTLQRDDLIIGIDLKDYTLNFFDTYLSKNA